MRCSDENAILTNNKYALLKCREILQILKTWIKKKLKICKYYKLF